MFDTRFVIKQLKECLPCVLKVYLVHLLLFNYSILMPGSVLHSFHCKEISSECSVSVFGFCLNAFI